MSARIELAAEEHPIAIVNFKTAQSAGTISIGGFTLPIAIANDRWDIFGKCAG